MRASTKMASKMVSMATMRWDDDDDSDSDNSDNSDNGNNTNNEISPTKKKDADKGSAGTITTNTGTITTNTGTITTNTGNTNTTPSTNTTVISTASTTITDSTANATITQTIINDRSDNDDDDETWYDPINEENSRSDKGTSKSNYDFWIPTRTRRTTTTDRSYHLSANNTTICASDSDQLSLHTIPTCGNDDDGLSANKKPLYPSDNDGLSANEKPLYPSDSHGLSADKKPIYPSDNDGLSADKKPLYPSDNHGLSADKKPLYPSDNNGLSSSKKAVRINDNRNVQLYDNLRQSMPKEMISNQSTTDIDKTVNDGTYFCLRPRPPHAPHSTTIPDSLINGSTVQFASPNSPPINGQCLDSTSSYVQPSHKRNKNKKSHHHHHRREAKEGLDVLVARGPSDLVDGSKEVDKNYFDERTGKGVFLEESALHYSNNSVAYRPDDSKNAHDDFKDRHASHHSESRVKNREVQTKSDWLDAVFSELSIQPPHIEDSVRQQQQQQQSVSILKNISGPDAELLKLARVVEVIVERHSPRPVLLSELPSIIAKVYAGFIDPLEDARYRISWLQLISYYSSESVQFIDVNNDKALFYIKQQEKR